ncbi:MAG: homoserine kinase [Gammaproteobacteria bacterium]|nr:homoserine kinase [Gammaproteobacteria bacterium]
MSVYTTVSASELAQFLTRYNVGELESFQGISDGIENTNYFVSTRNAQGTQQFVLTLFETLASEDLPYYLELMAYLAQQGVPSAHPIADRDAHYLQHLNGKPTALVQRLAGRATTTPTQQQYATVAATMAQMHRAGQKFPLQRQNARNLDWMLDAARKLQDKLDPDIRSFLDAELTFQLQQDLARLPHGVIHADLFLDNVLFDGNHLSGLIDFYFACNDILIYDLAVLINDWCSDEQGELNLALVKTMLIAYHAERPLGANEIAAWPTMLRKAALRFWLSRLLDSYHPRAGELTHTKDPAVFERILRKRIQQQTQLLTLLEETVA